MQTKHIILSASALVILIALFVLFFKVQASPAADIPAEALAQARQRHERARAARGALAAAPATVQETHSLSKPEPAGEPSVPPPRIEPAEPGMDDREPYMGDSPRDMPKLPPGIEPTGPLKESLERSMRLREGLSEANRLYDSKDFEGAVAKAKEMLAEAPGNVRMLRVIVSSACMMGDTAMAKEYQEKLPPHDQRQMQTRCARHGIELMVAEGTP